MNNENRRGRSSDDPDSNETSEGPFQMATLDEDASESKPSAALVKAMQAEMKRTGGGVSDIVQNVLSTQGAIPEESTQESALHPPGLKRRKSTAHHSERHSSVLEQIQRSLNYATVGARIKDHVDIADPATEDIRMASKFAKKEEEVKDVKTLIAQLRDLPYPMAVKKEYRQVLIRTTGVLEHESLTGRAYHGMVKGFNRVPRAFKGFKDRFSMWASSFKAIESRFGTGTLSYFVFLKWLLTMNIFMFTINFVFIILPMFFSAVPVVDFNATSSNLSAPHNLKEAEDDFFSSPEILELPTLSEFKVARKEKPGLVESSKNSSLLVSRMFDDDDLVDELGSLLDTYAVDDFVSATVYYGKKNMSQKMRKKLAHMCLRSYVLYIRHLQAKSTVLSKIQDFFQGTGWMENTTMFMGFYLPIDRKAGRWTYKMPVAFITVLAFSGVTVVALMITYASKGVKESMMGKLQERYCSIVLCGWDHCVEDRKAAERRHDSIYHELISSLAEEHRSSLLKKLTKKQKTKIYTIRFFNQLMNLGALVAAYYLLFTVSQWQGKVAKKGKGSPGMLVLIAGFLPSLTITFLNFAIPLFVYTLIQFESYSEKQRINIILFRVVVLRLASIVLLMSSFYQNIMCEPRSPCGRGYLKCQAPLCWETYVGKQMYRLAIVNIIVHFCVIFFWETPRNFVVKKYKNRFTRMLGRPVFDVATEVLSVVYLQTLCWIGSFYCPFLPLITAIEIVLLFYMKKYTVLKNCAPPRVQYKASRSNAIFVLVLLVSFFMTIIILGYSITQIPPSPGCGPFRFYYFAPEAIKSAIRSVSPAASDILNYIFSPVFVIPLGVLLCLLVYFFMTKASAYKEMVKVLKVQLTLEGKDKQFLLHRILRIKPAYRHKVVHVD